MKNSLATGKQQQWKMSEIEKLISKLSKARKKEKKNNQVKAIKNNNPQLTKDFQRPHDFSSLSPPCTLFSPLFTNEQRDVSRSYHN